MNCKLFFLTVIFIAGSQELLGYTHSLTNPTQNPVEFHAKAPGKCECRVTVQPGKKGSCEIGGWCKGMCLSYVEVKDTVTGKTSTHKTLECGNQEYEWDGSGIAHKITNTYQLINRSRSDQTVTLHMNGQNCPTVTIKAPAMKCQFSGHEFCEKSYGEKVTAVLPANCNCTSKQTYGDKTRNWTVCGNGTFDMDSDGLSLAIPEL